MVSARVMQDCRTLRRRLTDRVGNIEDVSAFSMAVRILQSPLARPANLLRTHVSTSIASTAGSQTLSVLSVSGALISEVVVSASLTVAPLTPTESPAASDPPRFRAKPSTD